MQIRNNNIKNELVSAALIAAACETYIHHSRTNNTLTEKRKTEILLKVGVIFSRLETIHSLSIQLTGDLNNNILKNTIDGEKNILKENVLDLPNFNWLENLELTCCAEFFFEALCCGVREAGLKQQNLLFKSGTAFRTSLEKELNILKQNAVETKTRFLRRNAL